MELLIENDETGNNQLKSESGRWSFGIWQNKYNNSDNTSKISIDGNLSIIRRLRIIAGFEKLFMEMLFSHLVS